MRVKYIFIRRLRLPAGLPEEIFNLIIGFSSALSYWHLRLACDGGYVRIKFINTVEFSLGILETHQYTIIIKSGLNFQD